MIFQVTENDLNCGREGGVIPGIGYRRGYVQLIEDLNWHKANNYWDSSRELFESSHTVKLNVFE